MSPLNITQPLGIWSMPWLLFQVMSNIAKMGYQPLNISYLFWLVVDLPLWKILVNWDDYSQYMESHKIPWFQTHQPVFICLVKSSVQSPPFRHRGAFHLGLHDTPRRRRLLKTMAVGGVPVASGYGKRHGQWIGLRENLQKKTSFDGKIYGFRLRFSLKPIHWYGKMDENGPFIDDFWWFTLLVMFHGYVKFLESIGI